MIISFHGGNTIRFQTGDMVIAVNPSVVPHGGKPARFGSDMVLCSSFRPEHHAVDRVSHGDSEPFVIDGPGSYEYKGYTVLGEQLGKDFSDEAQGTAAYSFVMDDIHVCVLGSIVTRDQYHPDISELISEADVLVLPVDVEQFGPTQNTINFIDPKIIIPVGFWDTSDAGIKQFISEFGSKDSVFQDKMTIKRKDIESLSKQVTPLSA